MVKKPSLPPGFKTKGVFGKGQATQVDSPKALSRQAEARKRTRDLKEAEQLDQEENAELFNESESDSDDEKVSGKTDGARINWGPQIDLRFGAWIKKIPYKVSGVTMHMAGCIPCEATGATRGLGAKPTKRIKMYTFKEHQESEEHQKVAFIL